MLQAEKEKTAEVGMWKVEIIGEFETRENKTVRGNMRDQKEQIY